jgi:uncharacterized protein YfaS (alpha-2-macroglobulin family)
MNRKQALLFILILPAVMSACADVSPSLDETVSPVPIVKTSTPIPTNTPTPTATIVPLFSASLLDGSGPNGELLPSDSLYIHFSQPVDCESPEELGQIYPPIAGTWAWDEDQTLAVFQPAETFLLDVDYSLILSEDLLSLLGNPYDGSRKLRLKIIAPPQVLKHTPGDASLGTNKRPSIVITFSREMDAASVESSFQISPALDYSFYSESPTEYRFSLLEDLEAETRYQMTVDTNAHDTDGIALPEEYRFEYWVEGLQYSLITPTVPGSKAAIVLRFNYPVDQESVEDSLIFDPPFPGDWTWNSRSTELSIQPHEAPSPDSEIAISFSLPVRSTDGGILPAPATQSFRTPPPILSHFPKRGDYGDYPEQISIEFSEAMNKESVEAAFQISPNAPGYFRWTENTLQYTLLTTLTPYTDYSITLDPGIRNAAGEIVLRQPFRWSFYSGYITSVANFGMQGAKIQVVDAHGLRPVQYGMMTGDRTRIIFELHELEYSQLAILVEQDPRFRSPNLGRLDMVEAADYSFEVTANYPGEQRSIRQAFIPEEVPPGIYLMTMEVNGQMQDQIVILVTSYAVVAKYADEQLTAWVVDIHGNPTEGLSVRVYDEQGRHILNGVTDENGFYKSAISPTVDVGFVLAFDDDGDTSISGTSSIWGSVPSYGWWAFSAPDPDPSGYHTYVYTDRPIYRPGQTVHLKAILRRDLDVQYLVPEPNSPVSVEIFDARENLLESFVLRTNAFGSVDTSFEIPVGASLGEYHIKTTFAGSSHSQVFKVEDYRKPDIRLTIASDQDHYVDGDTIQLEVNASYFFDQPVAGATVTVRVRQLGEFYGYWWHEDPREYPTYAWYSIHAGEQRYKLDEAGHASINMEASIGYEDFRRYYWPSNLESSTMAIEVTLDDGSHQNVGTFTVIKVFNLSERLDLETGGYFHDPVRNIPLTASLNTLDGTPIPGRELTLRLYSWDNREFKYVAYPLEVSATTDETGQAAFLLDDLPEGHYRVVVDGSDPEGREIWSMRWFGVYADTSRWSWTHRYQDMVITFDQDEYSPYEEATAYIESNFDGLALVSLERGRVHHQELIRLTPPLTRYDFTVLESFSPNIFLTASAWKPTSFTFDEEDYLWFYSNIPEAELITATGEIAVEVIRKELDLSIATNQERYSPGDEVDLTVQVSDQQGNPVSAEVSIALVDEAIYSLSDELVTPIFDAYYAHRELGVDTYHSMAPHRYIYSPDRGGGGGGDGFMPESLRSDFLDTAIWYPALVTDAEGEIRLSFTLPDNLTTWRISAKAITRSTAVGENSATLVTQKPLVVRPLTPRIVTVGDEFILAASIHNYSQQVEEVSVRYYAPAFPSQSRAAQELILEPGETRYLGWSVVASEAGLQEIQIGAEGETIQDAVSVSLPVQALAVPEVLTQIGQFKGQIALNPFIPEGVAPGSEIILELSPSLVGNLSSGLEYLTGFPYGCVEQIMSRALPNAVVSRVYQATGNDQLIQQADLESKVNKGLASLYAMQHSDGGWGWWYDDGSDDYQTAWVIFGLALTSDAGYFVDPGVLQRGASWLESNLASMDTRTKAFALYSMALAGFGNMDQTLDLYNKAEELDSFSLAALALALHDLGAMPEAQDLVDEIEARVDHDLGRSFWYSPTEDGHYYRKTMASTVRTTALSLDALVLLGGDEDLIAGAVRWLLSQRQGNGWGTTNETSFTLLALGDYLLSNLETLDAVDYQVWLNGTEIAAGIFTTENPKLTLELEVNTFKKGYNEIQINSSPNSQIYYVLSSRLLIPEPHLEAAGPIVITRTYHDPATGNRIENATAGELVKVRLYVSWPEDMYYVLIEDHLPGGLEALNENLNSESRDVDPDGHDSYRWNELGYNYKDVRGDRVSFFITQVSEGQIIIEYLARAARAGSYVALPAEAYPMYDLAIWGRSESATFNVHESGSTIGSTTLSDTQDRQEEARELQTRLEL